MNFDRIERSITKDTQAVLQKKLQWLVLELGVREDNYHIGTGLGGNNAQLFALMSFYHEVVVKDDLTIQIDDGVMRWGYAWFERASKKDIRRELDIKLPVVKGASLDDVRKDPRFSLGPNVSNWSVLSFADILCQKLASELDNGDESNVGPTAFALAGFPMEVVLMTVRRQIQIDRLIRHNLDEHPHFGKILHSINKTVDS